MMNSIILKWHTRVGDRQKKANVFQKKSQHPFVVIRWIPSYHATIVGPSRKKSEYRTVSYRNVYTLVHWFLIIICPSVFYRLITTDPFSVWQICTHARTHSSTDCSVVNVARLDADNVTHTWSLIGSINCVRNCTLFTHVSCPCTNTRARAHHIFIRMCVHTIEL